MRRDIELQEILRDTRIELEALTRRIRTRDLVVPRASRENMRVLHAAITRDTDRASRLYQSVGRYLSDPGKLGAFWLEYRAVIEVAVLGALWLVRAG